MATGLEGMVFVCPFWLLRGKGVGVGVVHLVVVEERENVPLPVAPFSASD